MNWLKNAVRAWLGLPSLDDAYRPWDELDERMTLLAARVADVEALGAGLLKELEEVRFRRERRIPVYDFESSQRNALEGFDKEK